MNIIVSILSDQLIPNVLFIKQMAKEGDRHVFLSSRSMENRQKSKILADTLGLSQKAYEVLTLEANRMRLIQEQLMNYDWLKVDKYIVNITGGTKMMSQATHLFFTQLKPENAEVYYRPITDAPLQRLFPVEPETNFEEPGSLDLKTYFRAHGFDYKKNTKPTFPFKTANALFQEVVAKQAPEQVNKIIEAQSAKNSYKEKTYYSGGWFEEWLYGFLKKELNLSNSQIGFNLEIKSRFSKSHRKNDNEIDVAFIYKNRLYIWECKVLHAKGLKGKKIADPIYKAASIRHNLGLNATSLVAVMTPFGKNKRRWNDIEDLSRLMQVRRVFSLETLKNKSLFSREVKKMIN